MSDTGREGTLQIKSLNNQDIVTAMNLLLDITSTCRKGFIKMVQNSVGGHLTMTSTSCRLLQSLTISKPVIRLIVSAVQGHLQHFSDGGHFVSMLILLLVTKSLKRNVSLSYLSEIYDSFLTIIIDHMNSKLCKIEVDISSLKQTTCFVKSIIGTKPLCKLNEPDSDYLSKLLIEIFVNYLPCESLTGSWEQNVHIICDDGLSVCNSKIFHGLLLKHHVPKTLINNLLRVNNKINVVVVTISMTGDTEELIDTDYEVIGDWSTNNSMLKSIMNFCDDCKKENIGVIFCQKVVHPTVKNYLYKLNIVLVERIGAQMIPFLLKLSGASPTRTFTFSMTDVGFLDSVVEEDINKMSYLFLKREKSSIATLMLTNEHEESVQELKAVCSSALHSIERLAFSPFVLPGGGCWEISSCHALRIKILGEISSFINKYSCRKTAILSALNVCCKSLQAIAKSALKDSELGKTDHHYHHFWRVPEEAEIGEITCSCGTFSANSSELVDLDIEDVGICSANYNIQEKYQDAILKRTVVIDQMAMCMNAVKTSFLTASSILSTNLFLFNGS